MIICLATLTTLNFHTPVFADESNKMVNELWEEPSETKVDEGEDIDVNETEETSSAAFTFTDFIRAVAATIFVIVLLLFLLKFINKKSRAYQNGSLIKNLGGTTLGSNKSIQIIKIGDRIYVVGVGENVQLLKEITEQEELNQILEEYNHSIEQSLVSSDIISTLLQRKKENKNDDSSFTEQFKRQIEDLKHNRKQLREELQKKVKQDDE